MLWNPEYKNQLLLTTMTPNSEGLELDLLSNLATNRSGGRDWTVVSPLFFHFSIISEQIFRCE